MGATTDWLAGFHYPVFSVEFDAGSFGFTRERLRTTPNVRLYKDDSRSALRAMIGDDLAALRSSPVMFYLDAHWDGDLPLREELEIIFSHFSNAIVIIDDFEVEGDLGYGFDDYGGGNALTFQYIKSAVESFALKVFYPALRSDMETGRKRGCVVLCQLGSTASTLSAISLLRARETPA